MDNLIRAAVNFQGSAASVEDIKQDLFVEFMNKIPIWDYYGVTRESYLALADAEKSEKTTKYYFDMKSRSDGKSLSSLFCFVWLLQRLARCILAHCFYCKCCRACLINSVMYKELSRTGFREN